MRPSQMIEVQAHGLSNEQEDLPMQSVDVDALLRVLQTAIGPVILISGAGLLLLTMTNRLGRVVDRSRSLARRLQDPSDGDNMATRAQLKILVQRTRLLRRAIALASYSVLLVAILVIVLFATVFFRTGVVWIVTALFIACMGCLIASLIAFIRDVNMSLAALKLEVGDEWRP